MIAPLFSIQFWLSSTPLTPIGFKLLVGGTTLIFLFAIACRVLIDKKGKEDVFLKRLLKRLFTFSLTISLLFYSFIFFTVQNIFILNVRVWFLVILVSAILWGIQIWKFWTKIVPKQKEKRQREKEKQRYL